MAVVRNIVLTGALTLGIATPALFAIAGLGAKYGLWDWRFGLLTLTGKLGRSSQSARSLWPWRPW